ncbi:MAG TPA: hypothetical protein VNS58_28125 [Puia sp.]|nr:hypothetical protein [Puia sp.]
MKNSLKAIRVALATLGIVIASQVSVLAASNDSESTSSSLSAGQIVGGFVLLLLVILAPLVKSNKVIAQK